MFAAQAAVVIANARRYTEENRAKADLEALINTSPVGVWSSTRRRVTWCRSIRSQGGLSAGSAHRVVARRKSSAY